MGDNERGSGRLFFGVGIGTYEHGEFGSLPRAVPDVRDLATRLAAEGFACATVLDEPKGVVQDKLEACLTEGRLARDDGVLVVLWTGHASPDPDVGSLRLYATGDSLGSITTTTPTELALGAARTGAKQILILLDTCYSDVGAEDLARVSAQVAAKAADQELRWTGVVAACQPYERAVDGAFDWEVAGPAQGRSERFAVEATMVELSGRSAG
jgi:hypothetical protein